MEESNIINTLITGLSCFLLIVPCMIIIFGISTLIIKPKQNKLFGYRTKTTLSSNKLWEYANKEFVICSIIISIITIILLISNYLIFYKNLINIFLINALILITLDIFIPIIIIEIKVRRYKKINKID